MPSYKGIYKHSGIPVPAGLGVRFASPWATHYFIDGIDGSDSNSGLKPDDAFATIQQYFDTATGGDVAYIRPKQWTLGTGFARYTEDVSVSLGGSGGSGVTATNANMSLIGVTPDNLPTDFLGVRWKYSSATPLTVDAPKLHIENIGFFVEDATYCINLRNNGATRTQEGTSGFSIYNCAIKGDGALYGNGANELQIINCRFQSKYDGTTGGINLVGSSNQVVRPIIAHCNFIGGNANNMATAPIQGAAPWYDTLIYDCYFNAETDSNIFISIAGTTNTGMVADCYFGVDQMSDLITNGTTHASGIYYVNMHDENTGVDMS